MSASKVMNTAANEQSQINLIVDGDMGGDEMQLLAVALAYPQTFKVLGLTSVAGNTSLEHVTKNGGHILRLFNKDEKIPVYVGADGPTGGPAIMSADDGDGAHGNDGKGNAVLPDSRRAPEDKPAIDFILDTLRDAPAGTITITATGPLTNIAQAFKKDPETMRKVKEIVIMGGCTEPMPGYNTTMTEDGELIRTSEEIIDKQGNITNAAEFNTFMAAQDAKDVYESGLPLKMLPMNCTHQLVFTPEYEADMRRALTGVPKATVESVIAMIKAPEIFEDRKFGLPGAVMHDVNTTAALLLPNYYEGRKGFISVETTGENQGKTTFTPDETGNALVYEKITDVNLVFRNIANAFSQCTKHLLTKAPRPSGTEVNYQ